MTLSLCMIVRNEAEVLARALSTARVYADEVIVVDTGSTDGTKQIARELADGVYDFEWCNDFSAARNYAFSRATCEYMMWLDADDIVDSASARAIARLKRTLDGSVDTVMLPYVLGTDANGRPTYEYYRERIVKRAGCPGFVGRVHEAIPLRGRVIKKRIPVYHAKPSDRHAGTRNLDIYRQMLASGTALTARERYYYARELYYNGDVQAAAREFKTFLSLPDGYAANKADASLMLARCYSKTGDRAAAYLALYDGFMYGLPTGEACCELGLMYFADGKYSVAAYWFELAARSRPDMDSGAFIDADRYGFLPYVWLSVCYDKLGKPRLAYMYHCRARRLRPDHPSVIANTKYFESLGFLPK